MFARRALVFVLGAARLGAVEAVVEAEVVAVREGDHELALAPGTV